VADWIHSPTCRIHIVLRPAGLHATARPGGARPPAPADVAAPPPPAEPSGDAAVVRDSLAEVIDPDLGVNIVDLGFVRGVAVERRTAVITMTLTSAACPLTGILEDQVRTALAPLGCVDDFRVDWQWIPAWRPADISEAGREQLRAIGFTV
jgi:metal-sulfur cluster biosynthetic enzyme